MKNTITILFFSGYLLFYSLVGCLDNSIEDLINKNNESDIKVSREMIDQLIRSFPSSLETSIIIKKAGNAFNSELLIPIKKLDRFVSIYDKAMAMGAFGSDMGYIKIYKKSFIEIDYLATIRLISVDLELDRFFDFENMMCRVKSSSNIDSLQQLSTENFNSMEKYLRKKGRDELSVLIVYGAWLEGAYIVSCTAKANMTEEMKNCVVEQKESVDKMYDVLVTLSKDKYFANLARQIEPLKTLYDKINIEKIMDEPEMEEINGELVIIDKSETIIHTETEIVKNLIDETIKLRDQLFK